MNKLDKPSPVMKLTIFPLPTNIYWDPTLYTDYNGNDGKVKMKDAKIYVTKWEIGCLNK